MALTWPLEQQGSTGEDVRTVQYLVTAQGHPTGVDGDFGLLTKAAVQAFQSSRGLSADGDRRAADLAPADHPGTAGKQR